MTNGNENKQNNRVGITTFPLKAFVQLSNSCFALGPLPSTNWVV